MKADYYKDIIDKELLSQQIAGASLKVIRNGKAIYNKQFGYQNIEEGTELKSDAIFRLYSMTKPITAAAMMILFERGIVDLLEPVSNYLEGFKNQKVVIDGQVTMAANEVTIQDLLNMTSGLVYPGEGIAQQAVGQVFQELIDKGQSSNKQSLVDFGNAIGRCPLAFEPSTSWMYGASADVLGAVIEVASGMAFGEFLKTSIFDPLGMVDTDFYVPQDKWHRLSQNYEYDEASKTLKPYTGDNLAIMDVKYPPIFESGGAGLVSTIDDYEKFATMLLNKGSYEGVSILGHKTVKLLTSNQLTDQQKEAYDWMYLKGYGYGNLMRIMEHPALAGSNGSVGEYGWDGWTGNYVAIDPQEQLIILYFIQRVNSGTTLAARKLKAVTYGLLGEEDGPRKI